MVLGCLLWVLPWENGVTANAALLSPSAHSEYLLRAWSTEEGLPENSATAIAQTPDGYLWFGTFRGLVRFDGVQMTVLDPGNVPEMPSPSIVNLHRDREGRLWASTYKGLIQREGTRWRQLPDPDGAALPMVRTFSERANGDLLITTFPGPIYEFSAGKLRKLPPPPGENGQGYIGCADEDGHWWVTQDQYVVRWENNRWVSMISPAAATGSWLGCAAARDGGIWLLSAKELRKLRRSIEVDRIPLSEPPGGVWSFSEDSDGNVWIASYDQGFCRVTPGGVLTRWKAPDGASDHGRCVFEDRERNLWLGTSGDGLVRLTRRRFQHFQLESDHKGLLVHSVSIGPTGGIWAATYGHGLYYLNEAGVVEDLPPALTNLPPYLQSVLADRGNRLWIGSLGDGGLWLYEPSGIRRVPSRPNVVALFEDSRGRIWRNDAEGGICCFDGDDIQSFDSSDGLSGDALISFAEDGSGTIWVASESGVFQRSGEQPFTEVRDAFGNPIRGVLCLQADSAGSIWLGSSDRGLLQWHKGTLAAVNADHGLPANAIESIVEDDLGFLWMTSGRQIIRARREDLEAVADCRISRLKCQVFDASDGLARAGFIRNRQPSSVKGRNGCLWFATEKGVAMINPTALRLNEQVPPVHVDRICFVLPVSATSNTGPGRHTRAEQRQQVHGPFAGPVVLPPGSRRIEIDYTALSLTAPERVRYQVQLEGLDAGWQEAEQRRTASYYELPPDSYVFRVRASNNDGIWNTTGVSLSFIVQPHFWQTGWFRSGSGLLLTALSIASVWSWSRRRLARALERTRLAHELATAELELEQRRRELTHLARANTLGELAGSLAHELNQPLTAILSNTQAALRFLARNPPHLEEMNEILSDIMAEDKRAGEVIHRLRSLLRKGEVQTQPLQVNDVVNEVVKLMRADLINHEVTAQVDLAPDLPQIRGDSVQLQQVLINLMVNACDAMQSVSEEERLIIIRTALAASGWVQVSVGDTGVGIAPDQLQRVFEPFHSTKTHGLGLGLAVCRTIITAHGGQVWATNNPTRGATFHFSLPLSEHAPAGSSGAPGQGTGQGESG